MKTRRLFLYVALVLLAVLLVGVPAQAGSGKVTAFSAYTTDLAVLSPWDCHKTGGLEHCFLVTLETVAASDWRFTGKATYEYKCIALPSHPQALPDTPWGPCSGAWDMSVTEDADGKPLSGPAGWKGVWQLYPQSDFRVSMFKGQGNGFGLFKGMKVVWDIPTGGEPYLGRIMDSSN